MDFQFEYEHIKSRALLFSMKALSKNTSVNLNKFILEHLSLLKTSEETCAIKFCQDFEEEFRKLSSLSNEVVLEFISFLENCPKSYKNYRKRKYS